MACDGDQSSSGTSRIIYQECLRECHIATFARVQGYKCSEFRPSGERNSLETVWCSNCGCYIKHHRKVENLPPSPVTSAPTHVAAQALPLQSPINIYCHAGQNADSASGVAEEEEEGVVEEGISVGERKKRRRLTEEQKQKVLDYAKTVNWSVKKQDDGKMLEFCADTGISTEVCRNWINNHRKKIGGSEPSTSLRL